MTGASFSRTLVALVFAWPSLGLAQNSEIETVAPELASRIAAKGGKKVAVTDFTDLQGRVTELGRYLAELLSIALVNTDHGLSIVDRGHIRTLLAEHKLADKGIIDPETASELGRIAGVDVLVAGTVTELGGGVSLSVKALDTKTALITAGQTLVIPESNALAGLIRRDVAGVGAVAGPRGTSGPPSVRPFQNDFLVVTVDSVAVSKDNRRATLALTFENKSSSEQHIGCGYPALVDDRAGNWGSGGVTGVLHEHSGYSALAPGSRTAVTVEFRGKSESRPSRVSFSVNCVQRVGDKGKPFSVGITNIPV